MRRHLKRAGYAALAAAAATALTAGLTVPPSASASPAGGSGGSGGSSRAAYGQQEAGAWVTLITGDRVRVDGEGRAVAVHRGPGRDRIPVHTFESGGHSYVVPRDATALVADGTLDRRLFDVTLQARPEYVRHQREGLKLIVDYRGERPEARDRLHAADGTDVEHRFPRLNAEAVTTAKDDAAAAWKALTRAERNDAAAEPLAAEAGVKRIWLDGLRRASLDVSVPQIGAPAAWEAGYDGSGVKIAVLDTGVDETHPDLAGQVVASENFSSAADEKDRFGHGTHVASIAAGTGARSEGKFTGVAPGADLLSGKVLDDDGYGDDSGILAGFEWAVDQGADIVNLSLGGGDTPEVDPLEEAVDRISAEEGVLFAVAAGNEGSGSHTISSPGSADAALTVGAVGPNGGLAGFSSRGPRTGDSAVKPDVTAPGVAITAAAAPGSVIEQEVGQNPDGYLTIDGTSMATPHVAGAAALLAQQHPDWTGERLKAVLSASAKPAAKRGAFGQGAGLIAVDQALGQSVVTEPTSLSFGRQEWPHQDDEPVTKSITYRNLGTEDVTLALSASTVQPGGAAAPAGMFSLGADEVTVPAGGTAEVPVTVDTRLGGNVDGVYSVYVTATGGGQRVVTPGGVEREVEKYDVTVEFLGRDGQHTPDGSALLAGMEESTWDVFEFLGAEDGTVTVRVPKGRYLVTADVATFAGEELTAYDWINQPRLDVTGDTTVTVDARTAKPVDVTVPDAAAERTNVDLGMDVSTADVGASISAGVEGDVDVRTAHLGPATAAGELYQQVQAGFAKGARTEYATVYSNANRTTMWNGLVRATPQSELAKLDLTLGSSAADRQGLLWAVPFIAGSTGATATARDVPYKGTLYVRGGDRINWELEYWQLGEEWEDIAYIAPQRTYAGGGSYAKSFNVGVIGPILTEELGIHRKGNKIDALVPIYLDNVAHFGYSAYDSPKTTLYRNGEKLASVDDLPIDTTFTVPASKAAYKLTTTSTRPATVARTSTKVSATWTFTSAKTDSRKKLPASVVRFAPTLSPDSSSKAGLTKKVPVKVLGSAAGTNLKSLTVWASTDRGANWKQLTVRDGKVTVVNPAAGKTVSFKAKAVDKKDNAVTQTIIDAYRAR